MPVEHGTHKIKVEIGEGSVTGAVTLTLEAGATGIPLGNQLKALKNTASLKLNGFITKLETTLLNGKLEDELLDGVKIGIDVNALKATSDGSSASFELLTVALKLTGDVGHWLGAGPEVKLTLDGQVQVALGGKLAAKLASHTVAQLEQQMLARELDVIGSTVAKHAEAIDALESRISSLKKRAPHLKREIQALEHELFQHRIQVSTGGQQLKRLTGQLSETTKRANTAFRRLEGKLARRVAWAMERRTVKLVAKTLAKLIPVLNLVSTTIDVIELIGLVRALLAGHFRSNGTGGSDDAENEGTGDGSRGATPTTPGEAKNGTTPSATPGGTDVEARPQASPRSHSPEALQAARRSLSPHAQVVVDALSNTDSRGALLDPDQLRMVGFLVPPDLSPDELSEVVALLQQRVALATSAEEAIAAIDHAVRTVRNRKRSFTVDGVRQPAAPVATDNDASAMPDAGESTSQQAEPDGPITSPSQVGDTARDNTPMPHAPRSDALAVVYDAPAAVIARWVVERGDDLVLSDEAREWKARNLGRRVGEKQLQDLRVDVDRLEPGRWLLTVTFGVKTTAGQQLVRHNFAVSRGTGTRTGALDLEPLVLIDLPPP